MADRPSSLRIVFSMKLFIIEFKCNTYITMAYSMTTHNPHLYNCTAEWLPKFSLSYWLFYSVCHLRKVWEKSQIMGILCSTMYKYFDKFYKPEIVLERKYSDTNNHTPQHNYFNTSSEKPLWIQVSPFDCIMEYYKSYFIFVFFSSNGRWSVISACYGTFLGSMGSI